MSRAYFLTGTDTEVGKTLIAAALLRAAAAQGLCALGMKPVAAGDAGDVDALVAASNVAAPRDSINPYLLREPLSPHIAAQRDGVVIDIEHIARCFEDLRGRADFIVVEGAGGFRVPLSEAHDGADLAVRFRGRASDGATSGVRRVIPAAWCAVKPSRWGAQTRPALPPR